MGAPPASGRRLCHVCGSTLPDPPPSEARCVDRIDRVGVRRGVQVGDLDAVDRGELRARAGSCDRPQREQRRTVERRGNGAGRLPCRRVELGPAATNTWAVPRRSSRSACPAVSAGLIGAAMPASCAPAVSQGADRCWASTAQPHWYDGPLAVEEVRDAVHLVAQLGKADRLAARPGRRARKYGQSGTIGPPSGGAIEYAYVESGNARSTKATASIAVRSFGRS